jgi:pSer/pThr/pTyr-binding forkhead associated (FHA) protein/ferredoxin
VVVEAEGPPDESVEPEREVADSQAYLVRMLAGDVQDDEYMLKVDGVTTIGRQDCDISFNSDNLLSDRHASISRSGEDYILRDDGSRNGVFLRATEGRPLEVPPGSIIRVGRQFLVIAGDNGSFGFVHYDSAGKEVARHKITDRMAIVGREAPDVTLDNADKTLSRRHLALGLKEGRVHLKDLKSVNGTYLKVNDTVRLQSGDRFRVGQQELTFMVREEAVVDTAHTLVEGAATPAPAAEAAAPKPQAKAAPAAPAPQPVAEPKAAPQPKPAAASGEPQVTFKKLGKTIPVQAGQSICEAAEGNGVPIDAECHAGMCGSDPIRIHSGHENLNALSDAEKDTIEDLCGLDPSECRMACMVRPTGPVEVDLEQE